MDSETVHSNSGVELCLPFVLASAEQGHLGLGVEPLCAARHVDGLLVAGSALDQLELRLVRCNKSKWPSQYRAVDRGPRRLDAAETAD